MCPHVLKYGRTAISLSFTVVNKQGRETVRVCQYLDGWSSRRKVEQIRADRDICWERYSDRRSDNVLNRPLNNISNE